MDNKKGDDLDFSYSTVSHNETYSRALILTLRQLIQNNDPASIGNLAKVYDEMPIDNNYKMEFRYLRDYPNSYLDSPTIISENNESTRRQILYAFVYGKYAHKGDRERKILKLWKTMPQPHWDMVYHQFELTLHKFVSTVTSMKGLNERVSKDYNIT